MSATIRSLAPLKIGTTVLGVERIGLPFGVLNQVRSHSGNQYPSIVATPGANPRITFRSPFKDAYSLIGLTALSVSVFELYLATFGSVVRDSGSTHAKIALNANGGAAGAVVQATGWSINQDGVLMLDCEALLLSFDGLINPLADPTTNNALPSLAGEPLLHTLGPMTLNDGSGIPLPGLISHSGALGQKLEALRHDGMPYPYKAVRKGGQPQLRATHVDPIALMAKVGYLGVNATQNFVQYFRSFASDTGIVNSANSISLTMASHKATPDTLDCEHLGTARMGVILDGLSANNTHPIAVSTSASTPAVP